MTTYDNFAHTFSESRKNMKWEEIEYFLTKYAPFGDVLDIGCGNGRLFGELNNYQNFFTTSNVIRNLIGNPENIVGENKQSISDSSKGQGTFSSYLGIDASEKLLEEAEKLYTVIPAQAGIYKKGNTTLKDSASFILQSKSTENGNSESQKNHFFQHLDMRDISQLPENAFDTVFFIASFHHLETFDERVQVLEATKKLLKNGGKIFLTNWALESEFNREKYASSKIPGSENEFQSSDFQIKIGEFQRFYHSFTLLELENLSKKAGFYIEENRLFDTKRNCITVLKK